MKVNIILTYMFCLHKILTNFPSPPFSLIYILQFHILILHGQIISIYYKDKLSHKQGK